MSSKKFLVISILLVSMGCSNVDSVKQGNDQRPRTLENTAVKGKVRVIQITEANNIVRTFLESKQKSWGKPTSIRNAPGKYIYSFQTPEAELRTKGPRMLKVNIHTGEVTIPSDAGGTFGGANYNY